MRADCQAPWGCPPILRKRRAAPLPERGHAAPIPAGRLSSAPAKKQRDRKPRRGITNRRGGGRRSVGSSLASCNFKHRFARNEPSYSHWKEPCTGVGET